MFPDLQECSHLTTSCLTPGSIARRSRACSPLGPPGPWGRGGPGAHRGPQRRGGSFPRLPGVCVGAPVWVWNPGKGRSSCSRAGASGGWDCPTRGRVSGPRTRPRGAGRGEGTREPGRPALRPPFPGQRCYLRRGAAPGGGTSRGASARGAATRRGQQRRGGRSRSSKSRRSRRRRRRGTAAAAPGQAGRARTRPAPRRCGRTWPRERPAAAAGPHGPRRHPSRPPVGPPIGGRHPPGHGAWAAGGTRSGRPEPLSARRPELHGGGGPRSGRCPGRSCPCRRAGRRRATSTARSTT
jgi:hypothetical protein